MIQSKCEESYAEEAMEKRGGEIEVGADVESVSSPLHSTFRCRLRDEGGKPREGEELQGK